MNSLLEQLHDIEGLDSISFWPLAIGWWVLLVLGIIIISSILYFIFSRIAFWRSWRYDTYQKLVFLEKELSEATAKATVIILSEYLRRIAFRRFSRKECAGLVGKAWLQWLSSHDPKKYDWEKKGIILIEVPYAPENHQIPSHQIKELINAAREWVR